MEKKISREEIFNGHIIKVVKDQVELDDKSLSYREVVLHNGGVCIALEDDEDKFLMVKQYRYAMQSEMYEFCAGKLELNEKPLDAILREAKEETGYEVKDVISYGFIAPTCGYCSEKIYLYSAKVKTFKGQNLDAEENISLHRFTLTEINQMIDEGLIFDAKTICLVHHLNKRSLKNEVKE